MIAGYSCLTVALAGCTELPSDISSSPARSMQITDWQQSDAEVLVVRKSAEVEQFLTLLRGGERVKDHKCEVTAKITVLHVDGTSTECFISPGHDSEYVELRYDRMPYRVLRKDLAELFASMNLDAPRWIPKALD